MVCVVAALASPQLSTEVGRIGQAECYREPEYDGRDHVCVLPVKYAVNIYQTLPKAGTKPNLPMGFAPRARILVSVGRRLNLPVAWWFWFGARLW